MAVGAGGTHLGDEATVAEEGKRQVPSATTLSTAALEALLHSCFKTEMCKRETRLLCGIGDMGLHERFNS